MEGQVPWLKAKRERKEKQAITSNPSTTAVATPPLAEIVASTISAPPIDNHFRELSCAAIDDLTLFEVAALSHTVIPAILNSGATSHLIHDCSYFWSYVSDRSIQMKTVNHGTLETEGHGDCLALLTLGEKQICLWLSNCLYAPGAMVNLLSVGRMAAAGWELQFKGNPSHCELHHSNDHLGSVPMVNNLCPLSIEFLRPSTVEPTVTPFVAFTPSKHTWDLWHARLGHLGGTWRKLYPL